MEAIQSALHEGKHVVTEKAHDVMTSNAKIQDLQRDIQDTVKATSDGQGQTTDHGVKIPDTEQWLKIVNPETGNIGPALLEDQIAREKIHSFDHERIPERVVHARGTGVHGYFKLTKAIPEYTTAGVLTDTSRTTPTFVRFSTVLGSRGSADTVRDVRGFATKFYTQEGNWDLVGNNIPVFFIQDAIKFPDVIHAGKPEPHNEVPQAQSAHNNFWDFQYLHTEATHMFMWAMSDRAIPRSYRMMQGFGVNTFTLTNAKGERFFVKFHWIPELGVHSLVWDEALKLAGQDPDFHRKDLLEAIDNGAYPLYRFGIQVIPEAKEHDFDFDILDATKVWPEDLVPVEIIGEMVLNRAPDEFFPETEQVAFCTSHVVPGIGFSDDPLLQGRNFSYFDTQITRLGKNWQELPINRPVCPVMNFNRDGALRHRISKGTVNYWPNRMGVAPPHPVAQGGFIEFQQKMAGIKARMAGEKFKEHFNQAQLFYNSLSPPEKLHLVNAFAFELDHCDDPIVYERMCQRLCDIDYDLAKSVAEKVGATIPDAPTRPNPGKKAKGLTQFDFPPEKPTIKSRRVAIIIADGFNKASFEVVHKAVKAASAVPFVIGPRRGKIFPEGHEDRKDASKAVQADHHFEGLRSTMFDALFIPGGLQSSINLSSSGRAIHYVREAFGHLKAIGAVGEGVDFLKNAVVLPGVDLAIDLNDSGVKNSFGVVTQRTFGEGDTTVGSIVASTTKFLPTFAAEIAKHRCWEREQRGLHEKVAF